MAANRTDLHRRIGLGDAVLAGLMTIVRLATAIGAVRRGRMDLGFLAVPIGTVVVFPAFVGSALAKKRDPEAHKRLMLIATTELLTASVGRWPFVRDWGALGRYLVTDLFLLALFIYDLLTRRRLHSVTVWGRFC